MEKTLKLIIGVIIIAMLNSGCTDITKKVVKSGADSNGYVAVVAGEKITKDENQYFLSVVKSEIESQTGIADEKDKKSYWEKKLKNNNALEEYIKSQALENAKEFKILFAKAKATGMKLSQEDTDSVNSGIDNYVKSLGTGSEGSKKYEEQYNISVDKAKAINLNLKLIQNYVSEEVKKVETTDDEVKKYYEDNLTSFQEVKIKHIVFLTQDSTTGEPLSQDKQDAAKGKAEKILKRIKAGEDMSSLTEQYSEDLGAKINGGEYTFAKGTMVSQIEDWAFAAKEGDIGLVKSDYGYHVIRLEKIMSFEDEKSKVKDSLAQKKFLDMVEQWKEQPANELKKNYSVYDKIKVLSD